jgi:hypothetical protein
MQYFNAAEDSTVGLAIKIGVAHRPRAMPHGNLVRIGSWPWENDLGSSESP